MVKRPREDEAKSRDPEGRKQHPEFTSGDLTIISSNGVVFQVDSLPVMYHSPAFRDLLKSNSPNQPLVCELTDDEIETGPTIALFLHVALDSQSRDVVDSILNLHDRMNRLICLIRFCDKWSPGPIRQRLCLYLLGRISTDTQRPEYVPWCTYPMIYAAGALLESAAVCTSLVIACRDMTWDKADDSDRFDEGDERDYHGAVLDRMTWPLWLYKATPAEYSWALGGYMRTREKKIVGADHKAAWENFEESLEDAGASIGQA